MAAPYLCRPFEWGADLVVHSTTKFLSGNGTSVGGAVIDSGRFDWSARGKFPGLAAPEPAYHGLNFQETFGDMAFTMQAHAVGQIGRAPVCTSVTTAPLLSRFPSA